MINITVQMRPSVVFVALLGVAAEAFAPSSSSSAVRSAVSSTAVYGYVPEGFTASSWKKFQEDEKKKKATKNLGGLGPRGFKSRSFQSFHEALERGEADHLLPVFNANQRIKKGEIRPEDVPYMQRGGSWDNSDVRGAKRSRWLKSDKDYATGGFRKEQSVSIFGVGQGLDWTGSRDRTGPESVSGAAPKFAKNYKAPNVKDLQNNDAPKKKLFGLF